MGMPHKDLEARLPAIVEYAELGQFIDAPIKTYSSGMRARLGFSIATSVEPDILLLDEVLATGDAAFREKSKQRVLELVRDAKAIMLVTHDMSWVMEYCTRAILLEKGGIAMMGKPEDVVAVHRERMAERKAAAKEKGVLQVKRRGPDQGSATFLSRATRNSAVTRPKAAPAASAPRQSSSGRMSPETCWAIITSTADGLLTTTRWAIIVRTIPCSSVASRAAIEPTKPWVTRASPASTAPTLPNSTASLSARAAPTPPHSTNTSSADSAPIPPIRTSTWPAVASAIPPRSRRSVAIGSRRRSVHVGDRGGRVGLGCRIGLRRRLGLVAGHHADGRHGFDGPLAGALLPGARCVGCRIGHGGGPRGELLGVTRLGRGRRDGVSREPTPDPPRRPPPDVTIW